ncbi:MAG: hypothetical protein ACXWZU_01470 [Actinomycetota bacterium]
MARAADAVLIATISFAVLLGIVAVAFVGSILVAGQRPTDAETWFLGIALGVAVIAALVYGAAGRASTAGLGRSCTATRPKAPTWFVPSLRA